MHQLAAGTGQIQAILTAFFDVLLHHRRYHHRHHHHQHHHHHHHHNFLLRSYKVVRSLQCRIYVQVTCTSIHHQVPSTDSMLQSAIDTISKCFNTAVSAAPGSRATVMLPGLGGLEPQKVQSLGDYMFMVFVGNNVNNDDDPLQQQQ